jgi:glycosyltransferase involved in cell wall biosynthesis
MTMRNLAILQQQALKILQESADPKKEGSEVSGKREVRVSAIVSAYNSERFVHGCLTDLVNQTLFQQGALEVVVVDSGSQQSEGAVVEDFRRRYPNIEYLRVEERETIYAAWNRGIARAKGRFITNANTDDRHRPDAFERMARTLDSRPDIALVYADCAVTERENETFESARPVAHFRWPHFDQTLLFRVCYVGPQPMWRRDLHYRYGHFDPAFRSAGDYEFWLRIVRHEQFLHIPEVLGLYLLSPSGVERGNDRLSFQESELARERHWPKSSGQRPMASGSFLIPVATDAIPHCPFDPQPQKGTNHKPEEEPLVSVIVPTYNRPDKLVEALRSILNQTYLRFEAIVVNDAGADIEGLISFLDSDKRITYIRHGRNRDRSAARNSGIKLAKGKYIAYLDDDDIFYADHLETLVGSLEGTDYRVAYSDAYRVHQSLENGRHNNVHKDLPYSRDFDQDQILINNFIPTLCLMHERCCLDEVGLFDESLTTHEDWDLWIRLSRKYHFHHIKKPTCEFGWRTDGSSTTSQRQTDFLRTMRVIYEKYRDYTRNKPHILHAQESNLRIVGERVANVDRAPVLDSSRRQDGRFPIEAHCSGTSDSDISLVMARVNRYIGLGKSQLAKKIVQKELGHLSVCREILERLDQLEEIDVVDRPALAGYF